MKVAYFDCFSGISGDMVLGALVDAGCNLAQLETELRRIPIAGWKISAEKVTRKGLAATRVHVEYSERHQHRSLSTILELIVEAGLSARVSDRASKIFQRLGEVEARVHGVPIEQIHFHEVGAVDAIVDIVGAATGFELLGIEQFTCSPLNVGGGRVDTQHGNLPVPAPATAELLRGAPTYSTGILRELVTPTGAAVASTLASQFGAQPAMRVGAIGYGAGTADLDEQPNVLRLFVGESGIQPAVEPRDETIVVLETNLDDMNPQLLGYFVNRALEAGALDVFSTPAQMKKNRPGQLVTVLCDPDKCELLTDLIFRETTTLGVRRSNVQRRTLCRESVPVDTRLGRVRVKVARLNGQTVNAIPEYEDCQNIAAERDLPLKQVLAEAIFQFQKQQGVEK
jgi:pyridinium-3,5-bisthiocarboxylic acid mononucleotide nickel chelatase